MHCWLKPSGHFSCQDFVIAIFGLGSLLQCVYWGGVVVVRGTDEYGEKMFGNHCMHPVKFEPKWSKEDGCRSGSVNDTYICHKTKNKDFYHKTVSCLCVVHPSGFYACIFKFLQTGDFLGA